jgi:uncharacterized protein YjbJ (UPF0337 family)
MRAVQARDARTNAHNLCWEPTPALTVPLAEGAAIRRTQAEGRQPMSSTTDKLKGLANEAAGNVKQTVGKVTGNERLQAEGKAQEVEGKTQRTVGEAKDGVKNAADKIKRSI